LSKEINLRIPKMAEKCGPPVQRVHNCRDNNTAPWNYFFHVQWTVLGREHTFVTFYSFMGYVTSLAPAQSTRRQDGNEFGKTCGLILGLLYSGICPKALRKTAERKFK
jgi:hypothetical protein